MSGATTGRQAVIAEDDDGIRLDRWFKRHVPEVSFNLVSRWSRTGALRLDGLKATPGDRVAAGQKLEFPNPQPAGPVERERRPLTPDEIAFAQSLVIHRDRSAIVIAKPPGLATQGGTGTHVHVDGLLDALTFDAAARPKLVHRLDKDTSGVLLLARTAKAAAFFAKEFAGRDAKKVYWGLTVGKPEPEEGMIDAALAKQPGTGGEKMHVDPETGLSARTKFRTVDHAADRAAWMEFQPLTGRTHQIRVHTAAIGHPLAGDAKYGGKDAFLTGGISRKLHLHARRLVIAHPDGGTLDISAPPPDHMVESFKLLGFDLALGDALPIDPPPRGPKPKSRRTSQSTSGNRRGERRSRGQP